VLPKPHRAGADEPTVPEPIDISCHSSVDIPLSTRSLDAAAFRPVWRFSAAAEEALAPHLAPASSALSARPAMCNTSEKRLHSYTPRGKSQLGKLGKRAPKITAAVIQGFCEELKRGCSATVEQVPKYDAHVFSPSPEVGRGVASSTLGKHYVFRIQIQVTNWSARDYE